MPGFILNAVVSDDRPLLFYYVVAYESGLS